MLARWVRYRVTPVAYLPLCVDVFAMGVAVLLGATTFSSAPISNSQLVVMVGSVTVTQVLAGTLLGVYRGRAARGSFDEMLLLMLSIATSLSAPLALVNLDVLGESVLSGLTSAAVLTALFTVGARIGWRLTVERRAKSRHGGRRTIIFGAGEGGAQAVRWMLRDPASPFRPCALLDDNPGKRNLRIMGVPVLGGRASLSEVVARTGAEVVLVAIPSASGSLLGDLRVRCRDAGVTLKAMPTLHELARGSKMGDIRDVSIEEVLGRPPSTVDLTEMTEYLRDKRVLVTGAGGSIGSELCRVLSKLGAAQVLKLDRDESALHAVQLSIDGRALLDSSDVILADIRDEQRMRQVFAEHRPQVVFHAAALKHLPLLESHPGEAVKTNVWGTISVLNACEGVEKFVNISTDKAADPISVLGWSKRVSERITAHGREGTTCVSVRFGNVLGSRGSVLHTFAAQAKAGGPITVTHPEVTRYFMTVTEAVHLVIAAGGIGRDGEALVLDMGEPASILQVAKQVSADRPVEIQYTGLRKGEKLHEQLFGEGETDERPIHPLLSHVDVPPLAPAETRALDGWGRDQDIIRALVRLRHRQISVDSAGMSTSTSPSPSVPPQRTQTETAV